MEKNFILIYGFNIIKEAILSNNIKINLIIIDIKKINKFKLLINNKKKKYLLNI
ncbi:MAG: hypothetical protein NHG07_00380 [Candidatus Shikimatogenerans bostrichidophilus]|nr:MAG: hypothetical protein NHG07_00380 [Candidatus Shikimatogenerans bostrichidophilus]